MDRDLDGLEGKELKDWEGWRASEVISKKAGTQEGQKGA